MSTINFLHILREIELNKAILEMPSPAKMGHKISLLEIGSGTGYQANILQKNGFNVTAIDLPSSAYKDQREFNIIEYDGHHLPCESLSMDIVFSSNVLEHIEHIDSFLNEIHRVLVPNGDAIHILPTATWRFWSLFTHYGWLIKKIICYLIKLKHAEKKENEGINSQIGLTDRLYKTLVPTRHGERGNALTEIYYFSESWWAKKFLSHGFYIKRIDKTQLFYTNASVFGHLLSTSQRSWLAAMLGSSCKIYILKKINS